MREPDPETIDVVQRAIERAWEDYLADPTGRWAQIRRANPDRPSFDAFLCGYRFGVAWTLSQYVQMTEDRPPSWIHAAGFLGILLVVFLVLWGLS